MAGSGPASSGGSYRPEADKLLEQVEERLASLRILWIT